MDENIHCHKCKKKTNNINPKIVQMSNGLSRIATKCRLCRTNKSKIMKKQYLKPIKKELNDNAAPCVVDDRSHSASTVFMLTPVSEEQLADCVRELRGGSSPGIDGISTDVIKDNFEFVKTPLLKIINTSLTTGIFPETFKTAKVVPIYKSGQKGKCENYRPISLLNVLSKVL